MEVAVADQKSIPRGPDLAAGIEIAHLSGTITKGRVANEPAILVRHNGETSIIGAFCSHYHGPLAEGLVDGRTTAVASIFRDLESRWKEALLFELLKSYCVSCQ
jgi:nitrite reductase/ring-hydroxylating ferredoxin subunit